MGSLGPPCGCRRRVVESSRRPASSMVCPRAVLCLLLFGTGRAAATADQLVANPSFTGMRNWTVRCPKPALCPSFAASTTPAGPTLRAAGTNERDYAWAEGDVTESLELGASYCLSTTLRWTGIEDPNRHVEVSIFTTSKWNEGITGKWVNGSDGWATATRQFTFKPWTGGGGDYPKAHDVAKIRLYFRFSAAGSAEFRNVSLTRCDPPGPRCAGSSGSALLMARSRSRTLIGSMRRGGRERISRCCQNCSTASTIQ